LIRYIYTYSAHAIDNLYTYKTLKSINRANGRFGSVVKLLKFNVLEERNR